MNVKAFTALIVTTLLWSLMAVISKYAVSSITGVTLLFLRMLIASIAFAPIFFYVKPWRKPHFKQLVAISTFSALNMTFYLLGIQYTSASASILIYAAMPILIIIASAVLYKKKYDSQKMVGVGVGFIGLLYIMYLSSLEKGTTISGSLHGNILVIGAMLSWTIYLLLSKKLSKFFTPLEIGSTSILWAFIIALGIFLFQSIGKPFSIQLNINIILAALYIGLCGTFLTYILFQYAIKHLSSLTVSLSNYLQPIATTFFAILFIGEKLTPHYIIGSLIILGGVLLSSDIQILHKRKKG
jgi:drug/metabolite transporter (DMT)-like permease